MPDSDPVENITLCSPRHSVASDSKSGQETPSKHALLITSPKPHLPDNHVLIRVDKFGFSANNITYEALGEDPRFRYFDFHPAPDPKYGVIPVWGFGTVVQSTVAHGELNIREGERVYGYFAPTRYLSLPVQEKSVRKYEFKVARPHFSSDRSPYNQVIRCEGDSDYIPTPEGEDLTMIYRPLFWTAYWCEDWLNSSNYRGGLRGVVISSASAKTAFCVAYLIGKRVKKAAADHTTRGMKVVALTSGRNVGFTKGLGLYDAVIEYGEIGEYFREREADERWLYIDVAGNEGVNAKIKDCLGQSLVTHVKLGVTNRSPGQPTTAVLKKEEKTETFFMPEWLATRRLQLSAKEIIKGQNEAWAELMQDCKQWVELERVYGADKVMLAYERVLKDGFAPKQGFVWSMWDAVNARL